MSSVVMVVCPSCGSNTFHVYEKHEKKPIFDGAGYDDDPYQLIGYKDIVEYRIVCSKCNHLLMKITDGINKVVASE